MLKALLNFTATIVELEEVNIIERLRKEPESTLKWMYDNYYSYVCGVVYRMVNDGTTAEDIAQEVFFQIWKNREKIELSIGFKPYIRRAVVNRTLNHIRSRKMKFEDEESALEVSSEKYGTVEKMEADELRKSIFECIETLPEKCRIVFGLSRFENLSYKEISEKLNISKKTVENQISKALKHLRASILQPA